jgi:hypothetical protein
MISIHKQIEDVIMNTDELSLIDADMLKKEYFPTISAHAYVKSLSRLNEAGHICRIAKGMYSKPKRGRFGLRLPGEKEVLEHFIGKDQLAGILTGYRLYNKYGLTTQISKKISVYSSNILQETKLINNIVIKKINLNLDSSTVRLIELLEIIENFNKIEDINYKSFRCYLKKVVIFYSDQALREVHEKLKFKKSTIASLKNSLDYYRIENSLDTYLNETSKYGTISNEVLHEIT